MIDALELWIPYFLLKYEIWCDNNSIFANDLKKNSGVITGTPGCGTVLAKSGANSG